LLDFLHKTLDNTYEVYFQPYLNGDNPDIIILREGSGAMIIEVKDWDLGSYRLSPNGNWELKNVTGPLGGHQVVKSPLAQVLAYKQNLYNLHIENLLERKIKNPKHWGIVSCAVYFHKANKQDIDAFLKGDNKDEKHLKHLSYFDVLGHDSLTVDNFQKVLSKRWMNKKSYFFDEALCESFRRYLKPPLHSIEQGIPIRYNTDQMKVIESFAGRQQKVKGVAGSGKTFALAKRAVNAHKRHGGRVLRTCS